MTRKYNRLLLAAGAVLTGPAMALADFEPADIGELVFDSAPTWLFQILTALFQLAFETWLGGLIPTGL